MGSGRRGDPLPPARAGRAAGLGRRGRATPASAGDGRGGRGSLRRARVFVLVRGGGVRRAPGPGRPLQRAGAGLEERPGGPRTRRADPGGAGAGPAAAHRSPGRGRAQPSSGPFPRPGSRGDSPARGSRGEPARGGRRGGTWVCPSVLLRDEPPGRSRRQSRREARSAGSLGLRLVRLSSWLPEPVSLLEGFYWTQSPGKSPGFGAPTVRLFFPTPPSRRPSQPLQPRC